MILKTVYARYPLKYKPFIILIAADSLFPFYLVSHAEALLVLTFVLILKKIKNRGFNTHHRYQLDKW